MRLPDRKLAKWATLAIGGVVGCQWGGGSKPYADNPLLKSREPIVQNSTLTTGASAYGQNRTPTNLPGPPSTANKRDASISVAPMPEWPTDPTFGDKAVTKDAATEPKTPEPTVVASNAPKESSPPIPSPVIQQAAAREPEPVVVPPAPTVRFDHAANYSWLQGEIDFHYRGYKELRFCSPSDEDAIGGKVRLSDDLRLADLRPGDLVRVEGELVRDTDGSSNYPRFVVRNVRVIERKGDKR